MGYFEKKSLSVECSYETLQYHGEVYNEPLQYHGEVYSIHIRIYTVHIYTQYYNTAFIHWQLCVTIANTAHTVHTEI